MAVPSPQEGASKWSQRLQASTEQIRQGVARVTRSPGEAAAASADLWHRRVTASQEKFRRKVAAVPLSAWQDSMSTIGVTRVAEGAQRKAGKYEAFAQSFYPVAEQVSARVKAMPKGDVEQAVARVRETITAFKRYGESGRI
jgi:hypothetical protein